MVTVWVRGVAPDHHVSDHLLYHDDEGSKLDPLGEVGEGEDGDEHDVE